jgi:hypothetical protein
MLLRCLVLEFGSGSLDVSATVSFWSELPLVIMKAP